MKNHPRLLVKALCAAGLLSTVAVTAANANTLQLSQEGSGEVLIFPYYTTRNGTLSFMSLVNQTREGKALRLRVRESYGGRPVAEMNVFLSPKDVWTAAIVPSGEGAAIISNDTSCTFPAISGSSTGLVFSNAAFVNDTPTNTTATFDRVREGYLEVIEMASLAAAGVVARDVTHVAGKPPCNNVADGLYGALNPAQAGISAPSGGIVGSMSFINISDGLSVSYNATALNGFWKTGPGAPVPTIAPVTGASPDLTSGANATITVTDDGKTYVSTFARSIDAVSALFMASSVNGEYGYTTDGVISSNFVMAFPTKAYYIHVATSTIPTAPATPAGRPFRRAFSAETTTACDDGSLTSLDREEFVGVTFDDFIRPPQQTYTGPAWCGVTYVAGFSAAFNVSNAPGPFNSPRLNLLRAIQNQGGGNITIGKEGGHLQLDAIDPNAVLTPISSSVLARSATTGEMTLTAAAHTYFGLPMLGFSLSIAKYNTGSPQQNFATLYPLSTQRRISTP